MFPMLARWFEKGGKLKGAAAMKMGIKGKSHVLV